MKPVTFALGVHKLGVLHARLLGSTSRNGMHMILFLMDNAEIQKLRAEIAELKSSVTDLRRAHDMNADDTTDHIKSIYQFIADIHDYLMPTVRKVFPGFAEDKKRIDTFMLGRSSPNKDG